MPPASCTHTLKNPNAPSALTYAWIGPFVGAAVRPLGGWISDKVGGSIVTQIISAVMVAASAGGGLRDDAGLRLGHARAVLPRCSSGGFLVLFFASGIGNGSTFRTIGVIFDRQQAGPVLGWTSAVAAYGAFIAPVVIGAQIKAGTPQFAMYGFAIFYAVCLVLELVVLPARWRGDQEPMKSVQCNFCSGLRTAWHSASSVSPLPSAPTHAGTQSGPATAPKRTPIEQPMTLRTDPNRSTP